VYSFGKDSWRTFERGIEKEWLVTNGIGGFASGTLINANTRKYHGLLVAAHDPPGRRMLHLAKLDERFEAGGRVYNLATNETAGGVTEFGHIHLQQVIIDPIPTFIYSFADITLQKQVFMVRGQNTTIILYRIYNGVEAGVLRLVPLVNCRGYHFITTRGEVRFCGQSILGGVSIKSREGVPPLHLRCSAGEYVPGGNWFTGMAYAVERERGESSLEDHYIPGHFVVLLLPGEEKIVTIVASVDGFSDLDGLLWLEREKSRLATLIDAAGYGDSLARLLVRAADAFIVQRRSTNSRTVIAGYPWFTDWGRDSMIALPGLTLVTRRYQDAREILITYARQCRKGLLPNTFQAGAGGPLFNTVDASLWYFQAVFKYLQYTGDLEFIREHIYPVLKDIVAWYMEGTDLDIGVDDDGLLKAGSPDVQLTWMDARVDGRVITPRNGKAVEINALWYNALNILKLLAGFYKEKFNYSDLIPEVARSYQHFFWDEKRGCLYDVIDGDKKDGKLRPNQLLAVSLPFSMLSREQGLLVFNKVWQELYATYGIRSLSPDDPDYCGIYVGDRVQRDGCYHQGTAWSWLIGPFVTACRRAHSYSPASRKQAARFIEPFYNHLREHGVGYISEIFDGNEPVMPRGCFAQAWGVAEVLRACVEDVLEIEPPSVNRFDELRGRELNGSTGF